MALLRPLAAAAAALLATLALTGCGASGQTSDASSDVSSNDATAGFPITITHALGETVIESRPERVVTVDWANQEAALALGVVPVGMPKVTWGDEDGDGILPWVQERIEELGGPTPVLFDETEGYDYEAIADLHPDVILAAYSGMTPEAYATLSKIAPVVAYPDLAWGTTWQELTILNGTALGLQTEAEALVAELEDHLATTMAQYPEAAGLGTLFSYFDPTDLSNVGFYTTHDPRAAFLSELGLAPAPVVAEASAATDQFWQTRSAEDVEALAGVDLLVIYGGPDTIATMQADPLLSRIPAVASGAVAVLTDNTYVAAAANPSPLSIGSTWGDEYLTLLGEAAAQAS